MIRVLFEPGGRAGEFPSGVGLAQAAQELGLPLRADCGGKGKCGQCLVQAGPAGALSLATAAEARLLPLDQLAAGFRLACQAQAIGPVKVEVPPESLEEAEVTPKAKLSGRFPAHPAVERILLPPAEGSRAGRDLEEWLSARAGRTISINDFSLLRSLSRPEIQGGPLTLVRHDLKGLTALLPGRRPRSLGAAVDVGTTTLATYLCDLETGEVLAAAGAGNPQRRRGEDVIARIDYANDNPARAEELHRLAASGTNRLLRACLQAAGADPSAVDEVVAVGNPTMLHLLAGLHPHAIGFAPYRPVTRRPLDLSAAQVGLDLEPAANVHLFPVVSGFIGGDTLAGALAEGLGRPDGTTLLVDIGTNGELILSLPGRLLATSCATGPALEGAHISCGMRAARGAIHRVRIRPHDLSVQVEVIGQGARPKGLCGSGLIDAAAALRQAGLMLPTGRLVEGRPGVRVDEAGVGRGFTLVPAGETASGQPLELTLADVRQLQLAKAALCTGIRLLLRRAGLAKVDRLVLTGAFGASFDWPNACAIGLLPPAETFGRVDIVENAAGLGAVKALLDHRLRAEAAELAQRIEILELAEDPDFATEYPLAMYFP